MARAGRTASRLSRSRFQRRRAEVATTGTPIAADSAAGSTSASRSRASSLMLRQSVNGISCSAICSESSSVRRMLLMSPTCMTSAPGEFRRMSRATRSSSDCGMRPLVPGVSMTSRVWPAIVAFADVISTVVPG